MMQSALQQVTQASFPGMCPVEDALTKLAQAGIARLFVSIYSTRMRGGYLRFQAQYLRRIRLPYWQDVDETLKNALREAANRRDIDACNAAVFEFYGLSKDEQTVATSRTYPSSRISTSLPFSNAWALNSANALSSRACASSASLPQTTISTGSR